MAQSTGRGRRRTRARQRAQPYIYISELKLDRRATGAAGRLLHMFGRFSALWKAELAKWPESQRKVCNTAASLCESSLESKQLGDARTKVKASVLGPPMILRVVYRTASEDGSRTSAVTHARRRARCSKQARLAGTSGSRTGTGAHSLSQPCLKASHRHCTSPSSLNRRSGLHCCSAATKSHGCQLAVAPLWSC